MDARLQRRIQRYGWDLAAADYEALWQRQLAPAQQQLLAWAALVPGQQVLDVACGTGLVSQPAARAVGPHGTVLGIDLSDRMVEAAAACAAGLGLPQLQHARMDAEDLALPDASMDMVLCALGLMYLPDPGRALREMRRVLRPGGRAVVAVWGMRARCGWSAVFPIVDAEVATEVCPLFFRLGQDGALARACTDAGLAPLRETRIGTTLQYRDATEACAAAFAGGPVALAWSRFDRTVRQRVQARYLEAIADWHDGGNGYRLPGEFVVLEAEAAEAP